MLQARKEKAGSCLWSGTAPALSEVCLDVLVSWKFFRVAPLALVFALLPAVAADSITGVVTNKTANKPSAGDDVVLILLQQGIRESSRTKTDAHGRFTLEVRDDGIHLIRVTHDKANYFSSAPPGTKSVEIEVFNAVEHVDGVTGEAELMRIETTGGNKSLHIVESFFVQNKSIPPLTQFSDRPFEFVLPNGALVESSSALGPGGAPIQSPPVPLHEKGHYTFDFPIYPGETRFEVTYTVPYSGSLQFAPKPSIVTDAIAVTMPKGMAFKPDPDTPYTPFTGQVNAQTFVALKVLPSQAIGFTLSGTGQLPRDTQYPGQGSNGGGPQATALVPEDQRGSFLYGACLSTIRYTEAGEDQRPFALAADANMCTRYIVGFLDALVYFPQPHAVCADNVRVGSVVRTYVSYMQNHPEEMTTRASVGLMETLLESYHCSVQK